MSITKKEKQTIDRLTNMVQKKLKLHPENKKKQKNTSQKKLWKKLILTDHMLLQKVDNEQNKTKYIPPNCTNNQRAIIKIGTNRSNSLDLKKMDEQPPQDSGIEKAKTPPTDEEEGSDDDLWLWNLLHYSAGTGHIDNAKKLIKTGTNINGQDSHGYSQGVLTKKI